jgi:hypothetical protein
VLIAVIAREYFGVLVLSFWCGFMMDAKRFGRII